MKVLSREKLQELLVLFTTTYLLWVLSYLVRSVELQLCLAMRSICVFSDLVTVMDLLAELPLVTRTLALRLDFTVYRRVPAT